MEHSLSTAVSEMLMRPFSHHRLELVDFQDVYSLELKKRNFNYCVLRTQACISRQAGG